MTIETKRRVAKGLQLGLVVGVLVGLSGLIQTAWLADPIPALAQTITVDSTQSPLVVNAVADLADLTPTDGQSVIIKTGAEKGLWYYDKDSSAATSTVVLNGPGSVGRFLGISNATNAVAVANVAALYALPAAIDNQLYQTLGYSTEVIGANLYRYDSGSSATPDYGFILDGIGGDGTGTGTGRFIAVDQAIADVTKFGALGDNSTNDYDEIIAAIDASDTIYFPPGIYVIGNNTILIDNPKGKRIYGNSFANGQTVIKSTASGQPVFRFVCSHWASLQGLWLFNESGDGVHWVNCNKATCKDIYSGRGVRDVAFLVNGSQQLYMENCWATSNSTLPGATVGAKYGFVWANWCELGTTVAAPSATGLDGLTLTLAFKGSDTVTVSGNTLQDACDAINASTETTGVAAGIDSSSTGSANRIMLYTRSFDTTDGVDEDNDLVLTDGTGTWAAIGHVAGADTRGDLDQIINGSMMHNCHGEGMGWCNMLIDGKRLIWDSLGGALLTVNQCVFQGGAIDSGGPTTKAVVVLNYTRNVAFTSVYMENGYVDCIHATNSPYLTISSSQMQRISLVSSQSVKIIGSTLTRGISIDSTSKHTSLIGSFVGGNEIEDTSTSTDFTSVAGANFLSNSVGVVHWTADKSTAEPISYNGDFEYWNGSTNPIGWAASSATIAVNTADELLGSTCVKVTSSGTADGGLSFSVPAEKLIHRRNYNGWMNVSFWARRGSGTSKVFTSDDATDTLTIAGHGYTTANAVTLLTTSAVPAGLSTGVTYWVVNPTTDTFQLSLSPSGSAVDITGAGAGTNYTALIAGSPGVLVTSSYGQRATTTYDIVDSSYPVDVWVHKSISFQIPTSSSTVSVTLFPDLDGTSGSVMNYDGVTISVGKAGVSDYATSSGENSVHFLAGHYIDYGAAAPVSGYYPAGSIRYNTAPAAGGKLGWVCVTAGTPGTWEEFASVAGITATVEASTAGSGAPNVLVTNESSKVLTNEGTTATNYHTLPTAVAGLTYTFAIPDTDGIRVTAATGDTIRLGANVTATAGYVESTSQGGYLTVTAINATEWVGLAYGSWTNGTWTYEVLDTP